MAVRLSYALISVAPGWGQPEGQALKIHIEYASGRSLSLPERFPTAAEAGQFIERFYPDLIGKCTGIDQIPERKPMKFPAGKEVSRLKRQEPS